MKKFFVSVGKAALYFLGYFGTQFGVSLGISILLGIYAAATSLRADGTVNYLVYVNRYNQLLSQWLYYILILSGVITILIFFIVAKIRKKKFTKSASLNKLKPSTIAPIVIGGMAFNIFISYAMSMIPFPESWIQSYQANSNELLGAVSVSMWISVVIMAPLVEELTFRGFMYTRLKQGMAKWIAILLTSLVFGIVHGTMIWAIYTFVFSLCLLFIFERTNSLWGCILYHMAFNFVGAAMSTWSDVLENINGWVLFIGSTVLTIVTAVWFVLISKNATAGNMEDVQTKQETIEDMMKNQIM